MKSISGYLPSSFGLNYPEFPDSWIFGQFPVAENSFNMLIDGSNIYIIQNRHHLLGQPNIFVFIAHFNAFIAFTGGRDKSQVFSS